MVRFAHREEILPPITLGVLNVEFFRTPCLTGYKAVMGDVHDNCNKLTNQRDGFCSSLQLCPEIHVTRRMLKLAVSFQKIKKLTTVSNIRVIVCVDFFSLGCVWSYYFCLHEEKR